MNHCYVSAGLIDRPTKYRHKECTKMNIAFTVNDSHSFRFITEELGHLQTITHTDNTQFIACQQ